MKCDELDAFIIACQDRDKPEFSAKSKIPKKGTIREAEQGERNKIRITFNCRMLKNVLVDTMPFDINTINGDFFGSGIDQLGIVTVLLGQSSQKRVLPSHLSFFLRDMLLCRGQLPGPGYSSRCGRS